VPLAHIHREAHRMEHGMTTERMDELDAALGHPLRDPHGDPIPTRSGQVSTSYSTPLTAWPVGKPARIAHLEDEPPLAYAQIVAEGLRLGQTVRIIQARPERYTLTDGENEYRLSPAVAANVCVEPLPEAPVVPAGTLPLAKLKDRTEAEIVALDGGCQGFTRRRFLDLGLTPGTTIYPELTNAFGDPRAYRVRGGGRGAHRRHVHADRLVGAFTHRSAGRSVGLYVGTAALPPPQRRAHSVHIAHCPPTVGGLTARSLSCGERSRRPPRRAR